MREQHVNIQKHRQLKLNNLVTHTRTQPSQPCPQPMNTHAKMTSPKSPITAFHVRCFDDVPTSVGSGNTSVLSPLVQTCYSEYVETRREAHRVTDEEPSSSLPASCAWNLSQPNTIKTSTIYRPSHNKIILFNFPFVFHKCAHPNTKCLNIYLGCISPCRIHVGGSNRSG